MPHAYTEEQLVEQPAIGLFAKLGWITVSALEEVSGAGGSLGREMPCEVGKRVKAKLVFIILTLSPPGETPVLTEN